MTRAHSGLGGPDAGMQAGDTRAGSGIEELERKPSLEGPSRTPLYVSIAEGGAAPEGADAPRAGPPRPHCVQLSRVSDSPTSSRLIHAR